MIGPIDVKKNRKRANWMLRWLGYLWPWPLTLTFDLENSRSNCISAMGGSIVMERKGQESLGCPDVKHTHYVTLRQRALLPTGLLKMSAFPSTRLVRYDWSSNIILLLAISCFSLPVWSIHRDGVSRYVPSSLSNIRRTVVGNKNVDHPDVAGAWLVGAAPTTSSFST